MSATPEECAVLGSILLAGDAATFERAAAVVSAEDFSDPRCGLVWSAMLAVAKRSDPIDVATVHAELRRMNRANAAGSPQFLGELTDTIPTVAHIDAHARLVAESGRRRRCIDAVDRARVELRGDVSTDDVLTRLDATTRGLISAVRDFSALDASVAAWNELAAPPGKDATWGTHAMDSACGLYAGQLVVLGAVPGGGKTALAGSAAAATARQGGRVFFLALEMPRTDMAWRLALPFYERDDVPSVDAILSKRVSQSQLSLLSNAIQRSATLPIVIDDRAHTADSACMAIRAEHARSPLVLVVVDYLSLLGPGADDAKRREDQVIRRQVYAFKTLAKQLGIAVLMLIQFNRVGAKADRPTMHDAHGGGGIEQGADKVVILVPDKGTRSADIGRVLAHIDKRRGGAPCEDGIPLDFDKPRQVMRDVGAGEAAFGDGASNEFGDGYEGDA